MPQSLFGMLCLLGIIAIAVGALLEVARVRRGVSIISVRQLRLRIFSALVWIIMLGALAFAVLCLWPQPGNKVQGQQFAQVVVGALWLLVIAILLLLYDVWQVGLERRRHETRFNQQLSTLAKTEIERVQQEHSANRSGEREL